MYIPTYLPTGLPQYPALVFVFVFFWLGVVVGCFYGYECTVLCCAVHAVYTIHTLRGVRFWSGGGFPMGDGEIGIARLPGLLILMHRYI